MAAYLDQHPDIYFARRKEPFFFSTDLPHAKAVTNASEYLTLFEGGIERRYRGEGSTWYLYSNRAIEGIREASPQARIIIMLRDPIELMVSQHQYNLINGNENIEDIKKALAAEPERKAGHRIPPSNRIAAALFYTEIVTFAPRVQRYWDAFGRDRVHVILFDDLKRDAGSEVQKALAFLDLDPSVEIDMTRQNETSALPTRRFGGLYRTMVTKRGMIGRVKAVLPKSVKDGLWNLADSLNRAGAPRPARTSLAPAVRAELAAKLRPGVDQLAGMLQRDLSHWALPVAGSTVPQQQHAVRA